MEAIEREANLMFMDEASKSKLNQLIGGIIGDIIVGFTSRPSSTGEAD